MTKSRYTMVYTVLYTLKCLFFVSAVGMSTPWSSLSQCSTDQWPDKLTCPCSFIVGEFACQCELATCKSDSEGISQIHV